MRSRRATRFRRSTTRRRTSPPQPAQASQASRTPEEYGGGGLSLAHEKIWREVKGNYRMMDSEFIISHGMCLPMLNEYGSDEIKKAAYMADNISGKTMWCQMFSEPGAGSDVASLQSKCELDGDEWILNGQKVWTTLAHKSDYGIVVARTDPEQVKHAGISMFILDMKAPGVEIRPIHQIDGGSHFNEVFFTDVRIPKDHLLGEYNAGWKLATAMLMYERVAIGSAGAGKINQPTYKLLKSAAEETGRINDPVVRDQLMQIYVEDRPRAMVAIAQPRRAEGRARAPPGRSLGKLFWLEHRLEDARNRTRDGRSLVDRMGPLRCQRCRSPTHRAQLVPVVDRRWHRRDPAQHHRRPVLGLPRARRRQGRPVQGPQGRHPDQLTAGCGPRPTAIDRSRATDDHRA